MEFHNFRHRSSRPSHILVDHSYSRRLDDASTVTDDSEKFRANDAVHHTPRIQANAVNDDVGAFRATITNPDAIRFRLSVSTDDAVKFRTNTIISDAARFRTFPFTDNITKPRTECGVSPYAGGLCLNTITNYDQAWLIQ